MSGPQPLCPSLNLVVIRSSDLERAASFYRLLGLEPVMHRHAAGPEHLACELGPLVLEIYPRGSTAWTRLGFRVISVDALVSKLEEAGFPVLRPPHDSPWGRRAVVADPDGHRIELTDAAAPACANGG